MPSLKTLVPDVREFQPSLVLLLWDGFSGSNVLAGEVLAQVGNTEPLFQKSTSTFVFGELKNGSYTVNVKSSPDEPFYLPVNFSLTLPMPEPLDSPWDPKPVWPAFPDILLADPDLTLDDPGQSPSYLGQRSLATLEPSTGYPFPAGATLLRGTVTAAGAKLAGALVSTSPFAQPGQFQVVVANPNGTVSAAQTIKVVNTPVLDSLDPATVIVHSPDLTLLVAGSGFEAGATVQWNGAAIPAEFLSPRALAAQVTAAQLSAAGQFAVTVTNPDGSVSNQQMLTVASAPAISSIAPAAVAAGSLSISLDVLGTGFAPNAQVELNGTALPTVWASPAALRAQIPAAQFNAVGQLKVVVINPGPPVQTSNSVNLTVVNAPVISALDPAAVVEGSPDFTLTVTGSGFISGAAAKLGANALPTEFHGALELTAQVTAAQVAAVGTLNVTVSNPAGTASNSEPLQVIAAPTISSITPATLAQGSSAFTLVIRGTGFVSGSVVELDGSALNTTFVDDTELNVHLPRSGYTTGVDGTFVLYFAAVKGQSQVVTLTASHPNYPKPKSTDVTVLRGATVSVSVDMSA